MICPPRLLGGLSVTPTGPIKRESKPLPFRHRVLNGWQSGRPAKPDLGGYFPLMKGRGELQEPSP
jgi:hypothetical protein